MYTRLDLLYRAIHYNRKTREFLAGVLTGALGAFVATAAPERTLVVAQAPSSVQTPAAPV